MAEETLRRNLMRAFDAGPEFPHPLLLSRTMAAVQAADIPVRPRRHIRYELQRSTLRLVAMVIVVAVAAVTTGLFVTINHYAHRTVPTQVPHLGVYPISFGNFSPVSGRNSFFFTANDAVLVSIDGHPIITHDGGKSWLDTPATFFFGAMEWIDAQHIYFWGLSTTHSTHPDVPGGAIFEETSDGGVHWRFVPVGAQFDPTLSFFLNPNEGWSLQYGCQQGQSCAVYHTTDSGAHWEQVGGVGSTVAVAGSGVLFRDAQDGFIGSESHDGVGRIFTTTDGGRSWSPVVLPAPRGGWPAGLNTAALPQMFGSNGILVDQTITGPSWIYTTEDAGKTWQGPRTLPASIEPNTAPVFVDLQQGWLIDTKAGIFRTLDGALSWERVTTEVPRGQLVLMIPVGGHVLWGVVSDGGSSFPVRSLDDGSHWSLVYMPPPKV